MSLQLTRDHRAILALLQARGEDGATTTEIVEAGYNGYRGRISELRAKGYNIVCEYAGRTSDKRPIHRYYLREDR